MKRISISLVALAMAAVTGMASAQDYRSDSRYDNNRPRNDIAQVIRVDRISNGDSRYERQECWNEQTRDYDDGYYRDDSGRLYS